MKFTIRQATKEDMPFVFNSWLNHARSTFPNQIMPGRFYFKGETFRLNQLTDKSETFIACLDEEPSQILGWVCLTRSPSPIVHYAFVKSSFRRLKIFDSMLQVLVPDLAKTDTIITRISKEALDYGILHKYRLVFNPYLEEKLLRL